jgi:hypothetical protein
LEELPVLQPVHTACKKCVFAEFSDEEGKPTQTGCRFGRREKYQATNNLAEAFDDEANFDIVNGRMCNAFRDRGSEWARSIPEADQVSMARREITLRVEVVIPMEAGLRLEDLEKTNRSIATQILKPTNIVFVNNQDENKVGKLHAYMSRFFGNFNTPYNWELTDVVDREKDGKRVSRERALDIAINRCKGHFYVVATPGYELPEDFILNLDRAVNDDLGNFMMVLPEGTVNGLTMSIPMHNHGLICGNAQSIVNIEGQTDVPAIGELSVDGYSLTLNTVAEKIQWISFIHKNPHMLKPLKEVCPKA